MRVIIAGAGDIGRQLLSDLTGSGDDEVVVVEDDEQRCADLADEFDALVICGDATDPDILDKAQIAQAQALVATTGSDPINTIVAMLAHRAGVERIIVKIKTNALRGALEEIGVDEIVAPTLAAAAHIRMALGGQQQTSDLSQLSQGGLQLAEHNVRRETEGRRVRDVAVPEGAILAAVLQGDRAKVPHDDLELHEGDVVLLVAEDSGALEEAQRALDDA